MVGSLYRCCCVAISIRGSNQVVSIIRGDVSGSEKKISDTLHELFGKYSTRSVKILISRLQVIVLIHITWVFDNHIVGSIIIVGIMIFSIVVSLSFARNLSHMYWRLELEGLGLLQLRMRQILEG